MAKSSAMPGKSRSTRPDSAMGGLWIAMASLISPPHREVDGLDQDDQGQRGDDRPPIQSQLLQHGSSKSRGTRIAAAPLIMSPTLDSAFAFRGLHFESLLLAQIDEVFGSGMLQGLQIREQRRDPLRVDAREEVLRRLARAGLP